MKRCEIDGLRDVYCKTHGRHWIHCVSDYEAEIAALHEAMAPWRSGGDWGTWKAWLVEGTRVMGMSERGLDAAQQITRWQVMVDALLTTPETA